MTDENRSSWYKFGKALGEAVSGATGQEEGDFEEPVPADFEEGGREIPDPPTLDDIDLEVGSHRKDDSGMKIEEDSMGLSHSAGVEDSIDKSRAELLAEVGGPDFNERMAEDMLDNVGSITEQEFDFLREDDIVSLGTGMYIDIQEQTILSSYIDDNNKRRFYPTDVKRLYESGEISKDLRDRMMVLFGENPSRKQGLDDSTGGDSGGENLDYSELSPQQLLSLLGQMVEEGKVSKMEAEGLLMKVKESKGSEGLASTEDSYGEMTGKFPDQGGESSDPEVQKLDEMLNRFRE